ncbi:MAG: hypothetical protein ACK6CO_04850, partial [Cyanobacteriota bacterium]
MSDQELVLLLSSAAFWVGSALLVGLVANLVPPRWLGNGELRPLPPPPAALPPGRAAVRGASGIPMPGIRSWKRWMPYAGGALPGGVPTASLVRLDPAALRRLVVETRRAELVHWALWPAGLLTALWLPPAGVLVNLVFATLFNLPCVLV